MPWVEESQVNMRHMSFIKKRGNPLINHGGRVGTRMERMFYI